MAPAEAPLGRMLRLDVAEETPAPLPSRWRLPVVIRST
ncbi:hypothetical protein Psta_0023 [Pirellula staleyi DSM 6068]|uniref:Uncharacterized protein n=1 Tax=Pirellula staleyi (strain ATCC 27377 / DSM 6068 / ICPB 4128) TaxID=530564 RepID=D2QZG2_PIRSD|nr:hypothetical protein Psta_0023 [Pirellula staleyi DSM 6068]